MKKTMTAFSVMVALGAGMTLAPSAHAGFLPDAFTGGAGKASKEHAEKEKVRTDEVKANAAKKRRAELQQVHLTRRFIAKTRREVNRRVNPPDYSRIESKDANAGKNGKRK